MSTQRRCPASADHIVEGHTITCELPEGHEGMHVRFNFRTPDDPFTLAQVRWADR